MDTVVRKPDVGESFIYQDRVILSFNKVNYFVKDEKAVDPKGKKILSSLSGIMVPGLNAIMGPTGGGKTSLLDVLAGRKNPSGLEGDVRINGSSLPKNFKRISGYVLQQDVVTGTLTVRENLMFCANLRLPQSMGIAEKKKLVQNTLSDLSLNGCADTKVGNGMIRGISGGEKKRACIAIELITQPCVLFLDEPTTGLDAATANAVMVLLKKLANRGRTIVFSIHQPRYSIYRLFDKLTLLSMGRLIYHGPMVSTLSYFENMGYKCQSHNNPADFFLDVINGDSTALSDSLIVNESGLASIVVVENSGVNNLSIAVNLEDKFVKSNFHQKTITELEKISKADVVVAEWFRNIDSYATPFWYQLCILSKRAFLNVVRNPLILVVVGFINLLIGLTLGVLFFKMKHLIAPDTQNRFGILFCLVSNLLFSSLSALDLFAVEKEIFIHEYVSGTYMALPYFLAKLFADLIPMRTVGPVIFATVTYWMVGLKPTVEAFLTFLVILLLVGYAAVAIVLFFASTFASFVVAQTFISLAFIFATLFNGLLLNLDSIVPWLGWIQYTSISKYGYLALAINEFSGEKFNQCIDNTSTVAVTVPTLHCSKFYAKVENAIQYSCIEITGECFLQSQLGVGDGVGPVPRSELWANTAAVGGIALVLFVLTYVQLARTKVYS